MFTLARKIQPCVIFLDELDSLFMARSYHYDLRRDVINELMAQWDGLQSRNDGILVMGATNRPFDLDEAVLRRLPRRILGLIFFFFSQTFLYYFILFIFKKNFFFFF